MPRRPQGTEPGAGAFAALFTGLPVGYRATAVALRDAIRAVAPDLRESIKWNSPFWSGRADVFCLQCYDDHVNLGVMQGAELARRFPRIEGTGRSMRHVKVASVAEARSPEVGRVLRAAVEHDRRGAGPKSAGRAPRRRSPRPAG